MSLPPDLWLLDDGRILAGGQFFALRLADVVAAEGARVRFVVPRDSELAREARSAGFEVHHAAYPRPLPPAVWAMPSAVLGLRRVLRSAGPAALVVGNTARCQAYAAAALGGLAERPLLVHLMQEQESARRGAMRWVHRRSGTVIAVGPNAAHAYRSALPGIAVGQVSNFMALDDIARMAAARRPRAVAERPVVGVLARMTPEKGLVELVDELAAAPDAWETTRVAALEQDARYRRLVTERIRARGLDGRVELLGPVDDLEAFFASIDVLVVPSTGSEAEPTVILEGLMHGRHVIVRDRIWSPTFEGLPVQAYRTAAELTDALAGPLDEPPPVGVLEERFGPAAVVEALAEAALAQRERREPAALTELAARPVRR